jgi:2-polyprenyl-3-methyl-5-hydroxy-6-metoxy-1,4-benzoquinol methylase
MLNTESTCDFCDCSTLEFVYKPINSSRGMKVYICQNCGLIQSISDVRDYKKKPPPSMSADANRSSVFYTKDIENANYTAIIEKYSLLNNGSSVLDIGSNRGAFYRYVAANYDGLIFHGIEPDKVIIESYKNAENVTVFNDRFENVKLDGYSYDLIYCVHTLEHADSARQMLKRIYELLKNDGKAFIAVPNTGNVDPDTVLEYFIDTHNYHFNHSLLVNYSYKIGFDIVEKNQQHGEDIIMVLQRRKNFTYNLLPEISNRNLYEKNRTSILNYAERIKSNREKLVKYTSTIKDRIGRDKLIIWGAGRILDVLISIGKLDRSIISCIVDKYLFKYMTSVHGLQINNPDALKEFNPNDTTIFIASKAYADEIEEEIHEYGFKKIIRFE